MARHGALAVHSPTLHFSVIQCGLANQCMATAALVVAPLHNRRRTVPPWTSGAVHLPTMSCVSGGIAYEDCPGRPALRTGPAAVLRGDRACGVLPDRGTGRAGP